VQCLARWCCAAGPCQWMELNSKNS
jgi:hypothetical protein